MSSIVTFYSYKGGVGRAMALANIAVVLAKRGLRILMVDFDLEAPGLHCFFRDFISNSRANSKGLLELLADRPGKGTSLDTYSISIEIPNAAELKLIPGGAI